MDQIENQEKLSEPVLQPETSDMVLANQPEPAETAEQAEQREERPATAYRILAVVFALLGVGGLFLGMIGKVWSVLYPIGIFVPEGGPLNGSLIGYVIGYIKALSAAGALKAAMTGATGIMTTLTDLLLIAGLAVAVLFSVVACFVALFSKKRARRFALVSGVMLFLAYVGLFLWSSFEMSMSGFSALRDTCDLPTAIMATLLLFILSATAIAEHRVNAVNALLLIVSLLVAFLTCYPLSLTIVMAPDVLSFSVLPFVKAALLIFMVLIAFNIVVSAARLFSQRAYAFDCFRFTLLLLAAILSVIAFIATPVGSRWEIFQGKQLYYTIGFLALCIVGFISALVVLIVTKRAEALAEYAETFPGEVSEEPVSSPEPAEIAAAEPVAAEAPAEPEPAAEPVAAETPAAAPEAPAEPEKTEPEPLPAEPVVPAAAPAEPIREAPISEFERRMAALARGEQPDYASAPKMPPQSTPMPPYSMFSRGVSAQPRTGGYADQYTYDPFITGLSPQEKNEFGDLFIACKAGKVEGLPVYSIGGNNEEFFRKVFIYLGKFRKDISAELLDKLYQYVSRIN